MITEQYVSFETAKLLKVKGFDEHCHAVYRKMLKNNELVNDVEIHIATFKINNSEIERKNYSKIVYYTAPTQSLVMRWLRENHHIHIMVDCLGRLNYLPTIQITNSFKDIVVKNSESRIGGNGFDTYEEACEKAIKYCLENLI